MMGNILQVNSNMSMKLQYASHMKILICICTRTFFTCDGAELQNTAVIRKKWSPRKTKNDAYQFKNLARLNDRQKIVTKESKAAI